MRLIFFQYRDKKKEKAQANKNADKKKTKHESVSEDTVSTEKVCKFISNTRYC